MTTYTQYETNKKKNKKKSETKERKHLLKLQLFQPKNNKELEHHSSV